MERQLPIPGAYVAGWRVGSRAAREGALDLSRRFDLLDLERVAAEVARDYMEDMMERHGVLTPRDGVHLFFSYFDGFLDGALLRAARHALAAQRVLERAAARDAKGASPRDGEGVA